MISVTVTFGQTVIDIAIQEYGCYEGVILLLEDNPGLGLTDDLVPGQLLNVRNEVPELNTSNQAIAAHYKLKNIQVNSSWRPEVFGQFVPTDFNDEFINN